MDIGHAPRHGLNDGSRSNPHHTAQASKPATGGLKRWRALADPRAMPAQCAQEPSTHTHTRDCVPRIWQRRGSRAAPSVCG
ncbi:hypothetical protein XarbCFBP8152_12340 [Xanthomonas arboricola]|nr:hypothetical protein XarbCFBP8152_12340 [Xanthomonas arboricola]